MSYDGNLTAQLPALTAATTATVLTELAVHAHLTEMNHALEPVLDLHYLSFPSGVEGVERV